MGAWGDAAFSFLYRANLELLTELGAHPALRKIEEIEVESAQGGKEFRVKFWLALRA